MYLDISLLRFFSCIYQMKAYFGKTTDSTNFERRSSALLFCGLIGNSPRVFTVRVAFRDEPAMCSRERVQWSRAGSGRTQVGLVGPHGAENELEVPEDTYILEVVEGAGLDLPYSCGAGKCNGKSCRPARWTSRRACSWTTGRWARARSCIGTHKTHKEEVNTSQLDRWFL
jgi:hypothetical protein